MPGLNGFFIRLMGLGEGRGGCGEFFSRPPDVTVERHAVLTRNVLLVAGNRLVREVSSRLPSCRRPERHATPCPIVLKSMACGLWPWRA